MTQNRKPPAYQEYASAMLSNKQYRLMSLAERGLLYAMRLECWENIDLPSNESELAKYLGVQVSDLNLAFTDRVKSLFDFDDNKLTCPELDDYRQHLNDRRAKQSVGGKKGSATTNAKFNIASNMQAPRHGGRVSLVKPSKDKLSKTQSLENGHISEDKNKKWVKDYENESNGY